MNAFLWEALWKSTLLLGVALAACRVWRGASAALRQLVLSAGVVATLAGLVAMAAAPRWSASVPGWLSRFDEAPAEAMPVPVAATPVRAVPLAGAAVASPPALPMREAARPKIKLDAALLIPAVWIAGAALILARLLAVL